MSAPPTIFVSYAHADKGTTAAIVQALQGAGLTVWWDADIPLGPQWQDVLQAKLNDCMDLIAATPCLDWTAASCPSKQA